MATLRRRKHVERAGRMTPEAVSAFEAGDRTTLHRLLRLPPWQVSPLDAVGECPWPDRSAGANTWPDSMALRAELAA